MSLLLLFPSSGGSAGNEILLATLGDQATINGPSIVTTVDVALPTLGDLATLNDPEVTSPYTLSLPTLGDLATVNAPNVFLYQAIPLPTVGGGPQIGGLWIAVEEAAGPTPTPGEPIAASSTLPDPRVVVQVCDPDDPLTVLATLSEAQGAKWQELVSKAGTGSCVLQNDDADLVTAAYGKLLRFVLDDRVVFLAQIENRDQVAISQDEDVAEQTEVGGRGIMAEWDDMVVYPEQGATGLPFSDQRVLNWTSKDFDDSGWQKVHVAATIGEVSFWDPNIAVGFPDANARPIWPQPYQPGQGGILVGYAYMRREFTVAQAGWRRLFISADDGALITLDGVQMFAEARLWFHLETQHVDVYLSAGEHQLAVRGENLDNGDLPNNSAWVLMSMMQITDDGQLSTVDVRTDSNWVGVAYPPKPPGMTVGRDIRVLLEEAQARGALSGWTLDFSDTADSAGQPWGAEPELSFQCGLDGYSVLQQLAEAHVELKVAPAQRILYAYASDYGQTPGISYEAGTSILALTHEGSA